MPNTYITKDAPAAELTYHRVTVSPRGSSPAELLSTAIGISTRKARHLLEHIGSDLEQPLNALRQSNIQELQQGGLTEKQAVRTQALIELGRTKAVQQSPDRTAAAGKPRSGCSLLEPRR